MECRTFFGVAGFAPEPNFEQWSHRSPPRSFFCKCILRTAIDFAERNSGVRGAEWNAARYSAWLALRLTLTNCGTASIYTPNPNPKRILINPSFKNLRNPICFLAHFFSVFYSQAWRITHANMRSRR